MSSRYLLGDLEADEENDKDYVKEDSEEDNVDSDFDEKEDPEMDEFITEDEELGSEAGSGQESPTKDSKPKVVITDDLSAGNFIEANKARRLKRLKKMESDEEKEIAPYDANQDDFIIDDIGTIEDKDNYTLEVTGPAHTSEAMTLVTSIFGDVTDFLKGVSGSQQEKETDEVEEFEKHVPAKPEKVIADCPERLLYSVEEKEEFIDEFLAKEAFFIFKKHFAHLQNPLVEEAVLEVLTFLHKNKWDVPFIALYKHGKWHSFGLREKDLWDIVEFDRGYLEWTKRFERVQQIIERKLAPDASGKNSAVRFLRNFAIDDQDLTNVLAHLSFLASNHFFDDSIRFLQSYNARNFGEREEYNFVSLRKRLNDGFEPKNADSKEEDQSSKTSKKLRKSNFDFKVESMSLVKKIGSSMVLADKICELNGVVVEDKNSNVALFENDYDSLKDKDEEENKEFQQLVTICLNKTFPDRNSLDEFVIKFLSKEIGLNPYVRHYAKKIFCENAKVYTKVTKKGAMEIDWTHSYFIVKSIRGKPVKEYFEEFEQKSDEVMLEQYSIINDAMTKGFIERKFSIDESLKQELLNLYTTSFGDTDLQKLKKRVIEDALRSYILPYCEKHTHQQLLEGSNAFIAEKCAESLREKLFVEGIPVGGKNVFAISIGDARDSSFCAVLNSEGVLIDYAKFNFLKVSTRRNSITEKSVELSKKNEDLDQFKNLILEHAPALIVIGASCFGCDSLLGDIEKVCCISSSNIRCELVDPSIAKIFEHSKRSEVEFFEYPSKLRNAVSLARFALDPLSEITFMTSGNEQSKDILWLSLHEHQKLVPKKQLLARLERELSSCISRLGIDVNNGVLTYFHKKESLKYACGLGPELVKSLLQTCKEIFSRSNLSAVLEKYPKIFENCEGFVKTNSFSQTKKSNPLDNTRVPHFLHGLAKKILLIALKREQDERESRRSVSKLLKEAKRNLRVMLELDIERCFEVLSREEDIEELIGDSKQNLRYLVEFVVEELKNPFTVTEKKKFEKLAEEELFWLVTGESKRTLRRGQLVTATVVGISKNGALCQMNCNVLARIPVENLPDGMNDSHPDEGKIAIIKKKVKVGMTLKARIEEINTERGKFSIVLDSRKETIENKLFEDPLLIYYPRKLDQYLDLSYNAEEQLGSHGEDPEDEANLSQMAEGGKSNGRKFLPRKVDFPLFKNLSREEAEKHLEDKEVGSLVIRPSSRGPDFLMATWKISRDPFITVNIEIKEKNKANSFSVGRVLEIHNMKFDDLDEIYARFFERMTARMKSMMAFRRFRFGTEKEVEQLVLFEKSESPQSVPYSIGFSLKYPGCFILFYVFSASAKREYIVVLPQGYKFRGKVFKSPEQLVMWFKKNPFENSPFQTRVAQRDKNRSTPLYDYAEKPDFDYYGQENGFEESDERPQRRKNIDDFSQSRPPPMRSRKQYSEKGSRRFQQPRRNFQRREREYDRKVYSERSNKRY